MKMCLSAFEILIKEVVIVLKASVCVIFNTVLENRGRDQDYASPTDLTPYSAQRTGSWFNSWWSQ